MENLLLLFISLHIKFMSEGRQKKYSHRKFSQERITPASSGYVIRRRRSARRQIRMLCSKKGVWESHKACLITKLTLKISKKRSWTITHVDDCIWEFFITSQHRRRRQYSINSHNKMCGWEIYGAYAVVVYQQLCVLSVSLAGIKIQQQKNTSRTFFSLYVAYLRKH